MNKFLNLKWIVGIFVLALFCVSMYIYLVKTPKSKPEEVSSGTKTIQSPSGEVKTADFSAKVLESIGNTQVLVNKEAYEIVYFKTDQTFSITFKQAPIEQHREQAENELLNILQISVPQACKLKVREFVPISVDEKLAGLDLGLSLCPDASY